MATVREDDITPSTGPVTPDPLANVDWKATARRWEQIAMEQSERADKAEEDAERWAKRNEALEHRLAEIRRVAR